MFDHKSRLQRFLRIGLSATAVVVVGSVGLWVVYAFPKVFGIQTTEIGAGQDSQAHQHSHGQPHPSIQISEQARANMQLRVATATTSRFTTYVDVPAVINPWPGRTHIDISSPLTGVITAIDVFRGEVIQSGDPILGLRLSHEDLVNNQKLFLTSLGELDVEQREIERLSSVARSGAIPGKTLLQREYERDKLKVAIGAFKQSLLLHGLSQSEVEQIEKTRELVREITIFAPVLHSDRSIHHHSHDDSSDAAVRRRQPRFATTSQPPPLPLDLKDHVHAEFLVTHLDVSRGASVIAGQKLGQLSDYSSLLIEGAAFQRDGEILKRAAEDRLPLIGVMESTIGGHQIIEDLHIAYIGNEIDPDTRVLPFYINLPNEIERSVQQGNERYVSWRYKPGQRLKLRIPVSSQENVIVVPRSAVAEEGPERYVFVENDDHFDRVSVRVVASDWMQVAIANDGHLWPGQRIAVLGAHQLQMAMKNQLSGPADPHAGHTHSH